MRTAIGALLLMIGTFSLSCSLARPCAAQVINGESTADSGYSKTPPAAWSPPSGRPEPSGIDPQDDGNDQKDDVRREPGQP